MSDFDQCTLKQAIDIGNKIGGQERAKRVMSGELVLVERNTLSAANSSKDLANGGVTYASALNTEAFLDDWMKFLEDVFKISLPGRRKIVFPKTRPGFGWGIAMPQGLSAQRMLDVLKPRFDGKLWQWCQNLDKALDLAKEARTTVNGPYVIWCRDRIEADEELKNLSANDLAGRGINCMTEPERIMLEGWFHWKTCGHLDIKSVTLSAGSRDSDGLVPRAHWRSFCGFYVYRCSVDHQRGNIRAREVVSF